MVEIAFILGSFIVPLIVSLVVCILVLGRVYVNTIQPLIKQAEEGQAAVDKVVKTGMSAMGHKSGEVRLDNALEKMVAGDLIDQFSEIEAILSLVSPDTAAALRENPEKALKMIERYKDFIPLLSGESAPQKQIEYDL